MTFESGQRVYIKPWTFHNLNDEPKEATFISYMAGREYAVLMVNPERFSYNIRARVEDLT